MKGLDLEHYGFVCPGTKELQFVKGGISAACFENFWDYVKSAFDFIIEYQKEIIDGFRRGWKNL